MAELAMKRCANLASAEQAKGTCSSTTIPVQMSGAK
jgi:hypothetical protein